VRIGGINSRCHHPADSLRGSGACEFSELRCPPDLGLRRTSQHCSGREAVIALAQLTDALLDLAQALKPAFHAASHRFLYPRPLTT